MNEPHLLQIQCSHLGLPAWHYMPSYPDLGSLPRQSCSSNPRTSLSEKKTLDFCAFYRLVCGFNEIFARLRNVGEIWSPSG